MRKKAEPLGPGESGACCQTKYPIMLVHGTGFRDDNRFYGYWGRIPQALTDRGARVFYSGQDAWGAVDDSAEIVKASILKALEASGAEKVNLIAHSKGGLESRHLISKLGMAAKVASLTTISTPHRGSKALELFYKFPKPLYAFVSWFPNAWFRLMGDKKPDFFRASRQMSVTECAALNRECPDHPGILYQSYGAKLKSPFSDLMYFFLNIFIRILEGDNDGLVAVESARWGNYLGIIENEKLRGVSHSDVVDLWRSNFSGFDIRKVYVQVATGLKKKGL
jgi:triacylglycerol lipase